MIFISKVLIDLDLLFVTLADSILVDCILVGFVVFNCEFIFSGALAVASYKECVTIDQAEFCFCLLPWSYYQLQALFILMLVIQICRPIGQWKFTLHLCTWIGQQFLMLKEDLFLPHPLFWQKQTNVSRFPCQQVSHAFLVMVPGL